MGERIQIMAIYKGLSPEEINIVAEYASILFEVVDGMAHYLAKKKGLPEEQVPEIRLGILRELKKEIR